VRVKGSNNRNSSSEAAGVVVAVAVVVDLSPFTSHLSPEPEATTW
jgi:hypothetical protein